MPTEEETIKLQFESMEAAKAWFDEFDRTNHGFGKSIDALALAQQLSPVTGTADGPKSYDELLNAGAPPQKKIMPRFSGDKTITECGYYSDACATLWYIDPVNQIIERVTVEDIC